jgi:hypothetical protein
LETEESFVEEVDVMKRIYIAGAITPVGKNHPVLEYLTNKRRGIRATVEVLRRGYSVFCPFTDDDYWMVLMEGEEIPPKMIYQASLSMLEVCDGVLVIPGWEDSMGTKKEMERAREINIPVFFSLDDLDSYFREVERWTTEFRG